MIDAPKKFLTGGPNPWGQQMAVTFTTVFAVLGGIAAVITAPDIGMVLPLELFYAVLLVNTYFSIRCFLSIIPRGDRRQQVANATLVTLYIMLPMSFGNARWFMVFCTLLFTIATLKHILLLGIITERRLLRKKIITDGVGAIASLAVLGGVMAGYPKISAYLWLVAFGIANVYLLLIKPLYSLSADRAATLANPGKIL